MDEKTLNQLPQIRSGLDYLLENDPVFSKLGLTSDDFPRTYYGADLAGLVRIVAGQQVSTAAAQSMWGKLNLKITPMTSNNILRQSEEDLRNCGLSRQKIAYIRGAAEAHKSGALDLEAVNAMSDEEVTAHVTALKGFGPWSAEIFLMFGLARPDIWPAGDLGIQYGLQKYLALDEKPDEAMTRKEGARFAPYRTAASILLWHLKAN